MNAFGRFAGLDSDMPGSTAGAIAVSSGGPAFNSGGSFLPPGLVFAQIAIQGQSLYDDFLFGQDGHIQTQAAAASLTVSDFVR